MTFHIEAVEIVWFLATLGLMAGGAYLSVRLVKRSITVGGRQELEAVKTALEREISRMKQQES